MVTQSVHEVQDIPPHQLNYVRYRGVADTAGIAN